MHFSIVPRVPYLLSKFLVTPQHVELDVRTEFHEGLAAHPYEPISDNRRRSVLHYPLLPRLRLFRFMASKEGQDYSAHEVSTLRWDIFDLAVAYSREAKEFTESPAV